MKQRKTDLLHRPPFGWRLTILPLIVIPAMVYLNVAPQAGYEAAGGVNPPANGAPNQSKSTQPVGATPINAAPPVVEGQTTGFPDEPRNPELGLVVSAPVHGIDGKGRHYLIERNPKWPMTEFTMRLKQPNTIVDRR